MRFWPRRRSPMMRDPYDESQMVPWEPMTHGERFVRFKPFRDLQERLRYERELPWSETR